MAPKNNKNCINNSKNIFINTLTPNFEYKNEHGEISRPENYPIQF